MFNWYHRKLCKFYASCFGLQQTRVKNEPNPYVIKAKRSIIQKFLSAGRKPHSNDNDKNALNSIHHAALIGNLGLMQLLIENGVDVNSLDEKGMTPLHYAVLHNSPDCASLLLEQGAKMKTANKEGNSAFHVACQYGQQETILLFLQYCHGGGKETMVNKNGFSPFDLACEHGRTRVVVLLLEWGYYKINNGHNSQIGLHLAAKNGHVDTMRTLLEYGFDVNTSTYFGTCLHIAVTNGKFEAVRLLLQNGADPYAVNANGQTPYDIARKKSRGKDTKFQQIKQILKEAQQAVYGKAICDYTARVDGELSFNYGDIIWIIDRDRNDILWKGVIFGPKNSRIGHFPASTVQLVDKKVGMQRSSSQRRAKKVCIPVVPDVSCMSTTTANNRGVGITVAANVHKSPMTPPSDVQNTNWSSSMCSFGSSENSYQNASIVYNSLAQTMDGGSSSLSTMLMAESCSKGPQQQPTIAGTNVGQTSASMVNGTGGGTRTFLQQPQQIQQHQNGVTAPYSTVSVGNGTCAASLLLSSPLRHRNSTGSTSSRSSSGFESMKSGSQQLYSQTLIQNLRGDSPPSRNSVHSSGSSSLGSLERLDETSAACFNTQANIAEMVLNGIPDHEIISAWLHDLHYEEYVPLFLNAGYDLATVVRMTPEDLTAIGITKPGHRKRLTTEIHKLNVVDNWPDKTPDSVDQWLSALRLNEYTHLFEAQGYKSMEKVTQLTWEDFEDIGVKKLGHLKKLVCALKKLKNGSQQLQQQYKKLSYQMTSSSSGIGSCGEVLVINVPATQRSLSDMHRPFSAPGEQQHHSNQSPQHTTMSTFQQSPKSANLSQEFSGNSNRSPTPCRSTNPYVISINAVHSNGQYAYLAYNNQQDPSSTNYDTFPPWRERIGSGSVSSGTLLRQQSAGSDHHHQSAACGSDFSGPLPSLVKIVAKTKRNSRDNIRIVGGAAVSEDKDNNNFVTDQSSSSASCENLLRKSYYQATVENNSSSSKYHPLMHYNSIESRYPCVDMCSRSVISYNDEERRSSSSPSTRHVCSPRSYSNGSLPQCGGDGAGMGNSLLLNNFHSPKNNLSPTTLIGGSSSNMVLSSPIHHPPPKKPPPPKSNVFQLSTAEPPSSSSPFDFDDRCSMMSSSSAELSPAPSVDEFPPPPFPIKCEEQIKNLRSIRNNTNNNNNPVTITGINGGTLASADMLLQKHGNLTSREPVISTAKQNRATYDSTASIDSSSSTETLPFAQENVGTIKQKSAPTNIGTGGTGTTNTTYSSSTGSSRPHVGDVFGRLDNNEKLKAEVSNSSKPGNVLNDIGNMLQDLTDQLDALLCEPPPIVATTKVVSS